MATRSARRSRSSRLPSAPTPAPRARARPSRLTSGACDRRSENPRARSAGSLPRSARTHPDTHGSRHPGRTSRSRFCAAEKSPAAPGRRSAGGAWPRTPAPTSIPTSRRTPPICRCRTSRARVRCRRRDPRSYFPAAPHAASNARSRADPWQARESAWDRRSAASPVKGRRLARHATRRPGAPADCPIAPHRSCAGPKPSPSRSNRLRWRDKGRGGAGAFVRTCCLVTRAARVVQGSRCDIPKLPYRGLAEAMLRGGA